MIFSKFSVGLLFWYWVISSRPRFGFRYRARPTYTLVTLNVLLSSTRLHWAERVSTFFMAVSQFSRSASSGLGLGSSGWAAGAAGAWGAGGGAVCCVHAAACHTSRLPRAN